MKVLKYFVSIEQDIGGTRYSYPDTWIQNKEKFPMVIYPSARGEETTRDGKPCQPVFVLVPDDLVDDMKIIGCVHASETEFRSFSDKHYPSRDIISDQSSTLLAISRVIKGTATGKDMDVLDPESSEPGVSKSKSAYELAGDYGVTYT